MSTKTTKIVLHFHLCLVLAAVVGLAVIGCNNERHPAPGKGRIVGKVTDVKGQPVSNCLVSLNRGASITLTDRDGGYAFEDVEPKQSRMNFTKRGYRVSPQRHKGTTQANVVADTTVRLDVVLAPYQLPADTTDPNYLAGQRFADQEIAAGCASWLSEGGLGSREWPAYLNPITGLPEIAISGDITNDADAACIAGHNDRILHHISEGRMPSRPRWWQYMYEWTYRKYMDSGYPGTMTVNVDGASVTSADSNTVMSAVRQDTSVVLDVTHRGDNFRFDLGNLPNSELRCCRIEDSLDIMVVGAFTLPTVLVDLRAGQLVPIYRSGSPDGLPPNIHVGVRKQAASLPTPKVDASAKSY